MQKFAIGYRCDKMVVLLTFSTRHVSIPVKLVFCSTHSEIIKLVPHIKETIVPISIRYTISLQSASHDSFESLSLESVRTKRMALSLAVTPGL